ncbi:MAG: 16S rRNA (cytidine(1402)-2'-O)-methyltransferase [Alphaproteobacteria bacterium]|nr:16S rRNA (cytidine(1402)-2'-O)-methyltransferase [Alphaproteobacteria bacterium]
MEETFRSGDIKASVAPGLYVAATPIGNLGDVSRRLVDVLGAVDIIYCEDTRRTGALCAALGVRTERRAYHDHNAAAVRPEILARLNDGGAIALVSDAGTPLISDPGYRLVAEARDAGTDVFAIPGPCAAIAALSVAGVPTDRFLFAGFPPSKASARDDYLEELAGIRASLVFYETANRLAGSLAAMAKAFGPRQAAIVRELTKIHEETVRDRLDKLAARYEAAPPKGEIVVVVGPPTGAAVEASDADVETFLIDALTVMSVKDAAAAAADALGIARKDAYRRAIALKTGGESG